MTRVSHAFGASQMSSMLIGPIEVAILVVLIGMHLFKVWPRA